MVKNVRRYVKRPSSFRFASSLSSFVKISANSSAAPSLDNLVLDLLTSPDTDHIDDCFHSVFMTCAAIFPRFLRQNSQSSRSAHLLQWRPANNFSRVAVFKTNLQIVPSLNVNNLSVEMITISL